MIFLQYDVVDSTSIWREYEEKVNSISASSINFFIKILYYNQSPVARVLHMLSSNNYKVKSLIPVAISYFELLNVIYCLCQLWSKCVAFLSRNYYRLINFRTALVLSLRSRPADCRSVHFSRAGDSWCEVGFNPYIYSCSYNNGRVLVPQFFFQFILLEVSTIQGHLTISVHPSTVFWAFIQVTKLNQTVHLLSRENIIFHGIRSVYYNKSYLTRFICLSWYCFIRL